MNFCKQLVFNSLKHAKTAICRVLVFFLYKSLFFSNKKDYDYMCNFMYLGINYLQFFGT